MRYTMILGLTPILLLGLAGCSGTWEPITPPEGLDDTVAFDISLENSQAGVAAGIDLAPPEKEAGGPAGLLLQQSDSEWSRVEVPDLSDDWALYSAQALDDGQAWLGGGSFVLDFSDLKSSEKTASYKAALESDLAGVTDMDEIEARVAAFDEAVASDAEALAARKVKSATGAVTLFRQPDGTIDIVDNSITTPVWSLSTQGPADGRFATAQGVSQLAADVWTSQDLLAELPTVHDIVFFSQDEGWAVGTDEDSIVGRAVHWADGAWTAATMPEVEGSWELFSASFPDASHGWAVGQSADLATGQRRGVALACASGTWSELELPEVSESWYLQAVCFPTSREGWAAGHDITGKRGVLLHFSRGKWSEEPISVTNSEDWTLTGLCLTSGKNGWAVGYDNTNSKLLLLKRNQSAGRMQ